MDTLYFIKPLVAFTKAYLVCAEVRPVKNNKHLEFGSYSIRVDAQYNPLYEHELFKDHISLKDAEAIMSDLEFVQVTELFDQDNVEDLRSIKESLPTKWVEAHNLWANYTG